MLALGGIRTPDIVYPQKGTFALPSQTVVAATIEVGTDVGSPNVWTSRVLAISEIENDAYQWRAQQIAIGKATDNTNFQPIGVDWQKIIRQKRAEKSVETEQSVAKSYLLKFWDVEVAEKRNYGDDPDRVGERLRAPAASSTLYRREDNLRRMTSVVAMYVSKDQHQAYVGSLANVDHLTFVAQGKLASGCVCEVTALVAYQSMFIGSDFLL
ncbi:hypothetical protein Tco_0439203 [Tanacetum coccineum]